MASVNREVLGVFDFSSQSGQRRFFEVVAPKLEGRRRVVTEDPSAKIRSDRQNKYYWPCFCERTARWLADVRGHRVTRDVPHNAFREALLRVPVVDEDGEQLTDFRTGEPLMKTRSTTELSTIEFNAYLDGCAMIMLDLCGHDGTLFAPPPSVYREPVRKILVPHG